MSGKRNGGANSSAAPREPKVIDITSHEGQNELHSLMNFAEYDKAFSNDYCTMADMTCTGSSDAKKCQRLLLQTPMLYVGYESTVRDSQDGKNKFCAVAIQSNLAPPDYMIHKSAPEPSSLVNENDHKPVWQDCYETSHEIRTNADFYNYITTDFIQACRCALPEEGWYLKPERKQANKADRTCIQPPGKESEKTQAEIVTIRIPFNKETGELTLLVYMISKDDPNTFVEQKNLTKLPCGLYQFICKSHVYSQKNTTRGIVLTAVQAYIFASHEQVSYQNVPMLISQKSNTLGKMKFVKSDPIVHKTQSVVQNDNTTTNEQKSSSPTSSPTYRYDDPENNNSELQHDFSCSMTSDNMTNSAAYNENDIQEGGGGGFLPYSEEELTKFHQEDESKSVEHKAKKMRK